MGVTAAIGLATDPGDVALLGPVFGSTKENLDKISDQKAEAERQKEDAARRAEEERLRLAEEAATNERTFREKQGLEASEAAKNETRRRQRSLRDQSSGPRQTLLTNPVGQPGVLQTANKTLLGV